MIKRSFRKYHLLAWLTILPILALACATSTPTQPPNNSLQAALTANEVNIQVFGADSAGQTLQKFETFNTTIGNRITLDEGGRGVLRFGDRNEVDLFGNTEVLLEDAQLESGGSIFIRVKQDFGHTHFKLNPDSIVRVTLETDDSTISTLEQGTEFTVCYAPGNLTCIAVREGSVEVTSQAEKRIYRKGEATFYTVGQPPQSPICTSQDEYNAWLASMRGPQKVQTLGQLVKSWSATTCLTSTPGSTVTQPPVADSTAAPAETLPVSPTVAPTEPPIPGPYVRINQITIDEDNRYVVEYETFGYTEQLPGQHVHFFFNTVSPEQAGIPGSGPWYLYGGPRPFREFRLSDRPEGATQMCALVANHDHSVQLNTGNCVDLPG